MDTQHGMDKTHWALNLQRFLISHVLSLSHSESNLTAVSFGDLCDIAEVLWKYALLCLLSISLSVFCLITLVSKATLGFYWVDSSPSMPQ